MKVSVGLHFFMTRSEEVRPLVLQSGGRHRLLLRHVVDPGRRGKLRYRCSPLG